MKSITFFSPGRINLLGEHTDYNGGTVLSGCLDLGINFKVEKTQNSCLEFLHLDKGEKGVISKSKVTPPWLRYWLSVLSQKPDSISLNNMGLKFTISSNLPLGAGLSSSSSLTCGFIKGLIWATNSTLSNDILVQWAVKSEHKTGVLGGAMDQTTIMFGKENHLLQLDTSTGRFNHLPFYLKKHELILFNSMTKHNLVDSEYNNRRESCRFVLNKYREFDSSITHLCNLTKSQLTRVKLGLSHHQWQKASYIIEEELRTKRAIDSIGEKDWKTLGSLLTKTHWGLSKKYDVSTSKLDKMVSFLTSSDDVLGARMMGAGFGGCVLTLIKKEGVERTISNLQEYVMETFNHSVEVYSVRLTNGLFV